jgi:hypothetical protein
MPVETVERIRKYESGVKKKLGRAKSESKTELERSLKKRLRRAQRKRRRLTAVEQRRAKRTASAGGAVASGSETQQAE